MTTVEMCLDQSKQGPDYSTAPTMQFQYIYLTGCTEDSHWELHSSSVSHHPLCDRGTYCNQLKLQRNRDCLAQVPQSPQSSQPHAFDRHPVQSMAEPESTDNSSHCAWICNCTRVVQLLGISNSPGILNTNMNPGVWWSLSTFCTLWDLHRLNFFFSRQCLSVSQVGLQVMTLSTGSLSMHNHTQLHDQTLFIYWHLAWGIYTYSLIYFSGISSIFILNLPKRKK